MSMIWALVGTAVVVVFYVFVVQSKHKKLPPGPIGFPLFGSLHLLGKLPHHNFQKLAQKYGPIMHIRLGLVSTIIVSSPQTAELFLKTHDLIFASRPELQIGKYINWDRKNILYSPYGSYWRNMRKMCTLELLSSAKISSFMDMRREELNLLIEFVREASKVGDVINLSTKIASLTADMSCRMVLGKKYSDVEFDGKDFKGIIQEGFQIASAPNLGDYIPFLAPFDLQGFTKRMKELKKLFDEFLDEIIEEHVRSNDENGRTKDFVDFMLSLGSQQSEYQLDQDNIKAVMLDMLIASIESSSTSIEWTISELIKNPRILKNLQNELEAVVGLNRMVEESDLENLEYLDMVVKEIFRLHPAGPLLAPHVAAEDCTVNGFHIPRKSHLYINIYAIGRDPNVWSDPETFSPERFMGSNNVDIRGRDFRLIPFGSGRRICPGMQLGHIVVKLCVAQLVHCFDWKLPNGMLCSELDMEEEFGLTTPRANHLLVIPTYRLKK